MFNYLALYRDRVDAILQPSERAVFLGAVAYVPGHEDVGQAAAFRVEVDLFDIDVGRAWTEKQSNRLMSGTSLTAWPGALALRVREVLQASAEQSHYLLLTDHRFLLLDNVAAAGHGSTPEQATPAAVLLDLRHSDVAVLRRAPRVFQRGRVLLGLCDGSGIHLVLGLVLAARAKQLITTYEQVRSA